MTADGGPLEQVLLSAFNTSGWHSVTTRGHCCDLLVRQPWAAGWAMRTIPTPALQAHHQHLCPAERQGLAVGYLCTASNRCNTSPTSMSVYPDRRFLL